MHHVDACAPAKLVEEFISTTPSIVFLACYHNMVVPKLAFFANISVPMVPSGLTFGPHKATDRTHVRARPGGSAVKAPLRGAFQKFENFRKKNLYLAFLSILTTIVR